MRFALLPAAGKSERMGQPKLALPLGASTVLECVIAALRVGGVEHVVVVVAPHVAFLAELATKAGAHVCLLPQETPEMRATVEAGLAWIEKHFRPCEQDDWLLVPADHPALDSAIVRRLCEARAANPEASIVVPAYQGQRGHPALISWRHVAGIRRLEAGVGLNVYFRQQRDRVEIAVDSEAVLLDLDTPADYERLRSRSPLGIYSEGVT